MDATELKTLLRKKDPMFWSLLASHTLAAQEFDELLFLSSWRRKAVASGMEAPKLAVIRLALIGGYSLYPLHELVAHLCEMQGTPVEVWLGDFDNYNAEIMDEGSGLYTFKPDAVVLLPSQNRCQYSGSLTDPRDRVQAEAAQTAEAILTLARRTNARCGAEIILANFALPARHDLGTFRSRTMASDWSFRKWVNLELGLNAPACVRICDWEFLAHRIGGIRAEDARGWFESKQPGSPAMLVELAREVAHQIRSLKSATKKVLVLDLDNTLWGGVVAEEGLEGIELGDTSPRGEAFKAFQKYILRLKQRGVVLGVCSKNDIAKASEPFEKHPEMVLRLTDIVSFKANWEPKSDNLRQMARELNLGLDSFVFVDDNPAEVEVVRQYAPQVTTVLLGPDPSLYVAQLQDCRLFEPASVTVEDVARSHQYQADAERKALEATATNMDAFLESLAMQGRICEFTALDAPRLSQLINKSNQFNLTTRRRSEAEVLAVMGDPSYAAFSIRLCDRFGDHGLISILIGRHSREVMEIDTWLMSCRVLNRQVEEEALNEMARLARLRGCTGLVGVYLPTPKNDMVRDFYKRMGFILTLDTPARREFELALETYEAASTKIAISRHADETK